MAEHDFFTRPVLRVRDVQASVAYYCDVLGFEKRWQHGTERLIIAEVGRDGIDVILDCGSVLPKPAATSVLSMSMTRPETLGGLYRALKERGARIVAPPFAVVWQEGTYEMDVEDLDGNVLVFWGEKPA